MTPSRIVTKLALLVLGLALLGGVFWVLSLMSERDSRLPKLALTLPQERERAMQAGLPQEMRELPKRPVLAEKDNAAPLYREAVNLLPNWTPEERLAIGRMLSPTSKLKDGDAALLGKVLKAAVPALRLVKEGVRRPHCDFGWHGALNEEEWKRRREILLACDRLAQLFQVYAKGHKQPEKALATLGLIERFTHQLTEEPGLLVWTIRNRHATLSARVLFLVALEYPERLAETNRAWETWRTPPGVLKKIWLLQCVKEQGDAREHREKLYKPENEPFLDYNPLWRELDRLDHTLGWQLYADASEVINLRYWRAVKTVLAPIPDTDLTAQWRVLKALDTAEDTRGKAFAGYWYPQRYSGLATELLLTELAYRLPRVALAIQEFERVAKKPLTRLEDLPPGTPITDVFSGKPLLLKEHRLYSVGFDGKDDGGDEKQDLVRDLTKEAAPPVGQSRRGIMRRPGRTAGRAE
ncbi:hypothetical protein [Armatimonas sp.]|uniref:hypothetical protein n=1 Tax=Armatimonas sp. TaxID=1872638 RepID=UPI00286C7982|nr:hypothetical protein [Armatimonas sp.]